MPVASGFLSKNLTNVLAASPTEVMLSGAKIGVYTQNPETLPVTTIAELMASEVVPTVQTATFSGVIDTRPDGSKSSSSQLITMQGSTTYTGLLARGWYLKTGSGDVLLAYKPFDAPKSLEDGEVFRFIVNIDMPAAADYFRATEVPD